VAARGKHKERYPITVALRTATLYNDTSTESEI
jgi:hypothetical protein